MANWAVSWYEITGDPREIETLYENITGVDKEYIPSDFGVDGLHNHVYAALVKAGIFKEEPDDESVRLFWRLVYNDDLDMKGQILDIDINPDASMYIQTESAWKAHSDFLRFWLGVLDLKNITIHYDSTEPGSGYYEYYDGSGDAEAVYSVDYCGRRSDPWEIHYSERLVLDDVRSWALDLFPDHPELSSMSPEDIEDFINKNDKECEFCSINEWWEGKPIEPYSVEEILGFMTEDN